MSGVSDNLKMGSGADENSIGSSGISEQLISLIEQAPIAIALFDCDMRYIAASPHWNAGERR
ncbi:MAG: hypothetical protein WBX25_21275, partial [Rhodomicrobium sp.]